MDIRLGDGMWDDRLPSLIGILFGHDATLEASRHRSEAPNPRLAPEPAEASQHLAFRSRDLPSSAAAEVRVRHDRGERPMSVSVYRRSTQRPVAIGRVNATSRTSSSQAPISTFPSHPQGVRRLPPRVVPYGSDSWRGRALTEALGPTQKPTAVSGQLAARGRWAKR